MPMCEALVKYIKDNSLSLELGLSFTLIFGAYMFNQPAFAVMGGGLLVILALYYRGE